MQGHRPCQYCLCLPFACMYHTYNTQHAHPAQTTKCVWATTMYRHQAFSLGWLSGSITLTAALKHGWSPDTALTTQNAAVIHTPSTLIHHSLVSSIHHLMTRARAWPQPCQQAAQPILCSARVLLCIRTAKRRTASSTGSTSPSIWARSWQSPPWCTSKKASAGQLGLPYLLPPCFWLL